jgi:serine phosphatase RsbU (regulator of sigma subunit)
LQRARRTKDKYARELADDLERARRFQSSLVPREPLSASGWHLEGRLVTCEALGGDFFVALAGSDASVVFAVSDIEGHGVRAAMYAGMLRSLLDTARRRHPDPASVQRELREGIEFFESESSASLVYGQLDGDGRLRYFNAGLSRPLLLTSSAEVEELETTALLLTPLLPSPGGEIRGDELSPGDRVLAFTDGVYEARNSAGKEWGLRALVAAFSQTCDASPAIALDGILERMREHASGRPLEDDATLLLIERRPRRG